MVTMDERLFVVSKWADEVAFRVASHGSSSRSLQLHLSNIMGDLLKADMDGQDAAATAVSAAAATLGSSAVGRAAGASGSEAGGTAESAAADAGHAESGSAAGGLEASRSDAAEPPMTLASIGRDSLALCRVVRAAQDLHTAAKSVRGLTGTTGEQEAAAVRQIVLKKARDWHGSVQDVDEILQLADNTMRYVGTPRRSGIRVSGALPPVPPASSGRAPAADEDAGGSMFEDTSDVCENHEDAGADEEDLMEGDVGLDEEAPVGAPSFGTGSASRHCVGARRALGGTTSPGGGTMELPDGGRRAAAAALLQPPLAVAPGGASGRSGRDGQPAAAATQANKAMGEVLAAITANMIESSRRADRELCAKSDERHTARVANLTKLILAEPDNQMFKDMLAAEMAAHRQ